MHSRCKPFLPSLGRWLLLCALTGAVFVLAGCAMQPVTAITLSGIVRGEQTALSGQVLREAAQLVRNGASYQVSAGMVMQPGDALWTGPDTSVVISYPGGARAYVRPSTRVRIGSIINDIGKVFVKVKGVFRVQTEFVIAGSEGTQYWVDEGASAGQCRGRRRRRQPGVERCNLARPHIARRRTGGAKRCERARALRCQPRGHPARDRLGQLDGPAGSGAGRHQPGPHRRRHWRDWYWYW